jgi:soluble lytic murein transglycosylase-like protein
MQLMPETASELSVKDVFDPKENIAAGAKYLKELLDKYKGDTKLALAAYNAGPAAVDAIGAIPDIQETRDYVDAIIKKIK